MKILSEIKKYSIVLAVITAVVGALFIIFPTQSIMYMSLSVGVALIIMGISSVISYLLNKNTAFSLALGLVVIIAGIVVCVKYKAIVSAIVIVFGIFILSTGLFNLLTGVRVLFSKMLTGWITTVISVVEIVFGIIAITKSTQLSEGIVQFIGVALILYTVLGIISFIQVKKLFDEVKQTVDNTIDVNFNTNGEVETTATIVEETDE